MQQDQSSCTLSVQYAANRGGAKRAERIATQARTKSEERHAESPQNKK
jgi:hypothetical protein